MEILNKNGMILMDYRREFKRHYADSVDEALKDAILTLYKENQIPEKLFRIILDDGIDDSVVYTYLLSRREFTKSSMELNSEFNEVRERVNDYLIKINFVKNVCTKNSINTNRIYIIKQYDIPKELLLSYFGLTPSEIIPLMKRKGFMDKFCVLRLSQAFKEIYSELRVPEHIDHGYSLIYYNKLIQGFSIDYKYMVNINYVNDEERMCDLMDKIKKLDEVVERKFESKMSYSYFQQLDKKMSAKELAAAIDEIVIPVRSGKRSQDIRKPELIVEEVENDTATKKDALESKTVVKQDTDNKDVKKTASPILVVEDDDDDLVVTKSDSKTESPKMEEQKEKPVEQPKVDNVKLNNGQQKQQQQKQESVKHEQPKKENQPQQNNPKQNNQQQGGGQQKNNNGNNGNKQKQGQQNGQRVQQPQKQNESQKQQDKTKPENKTDVKQVQKPDNKPEIKQEPVVKVEENKKDKETPLIESVVKEQPKPVKNQVKTCDGFDDEDDLLDEIIVTPKKEEQKAKSVQTPVKPTLIIDDSDTDLI